MKLKSQMRAAVIICVSWIVCTTLWSCGYDSLETTRELNCMEAPMTLDRDQVISAQVLLRSESGKTIAADTIITSETISDYAPSPQDVAWASEVLADRGFDVAELVGISFSITAPASTFEEFFETQLCREEDGGIKATRNDGSLAYEFPLDALPESISNLIVAVTFTPPPDFGPTDFFGPEVETQNS